MLTIERPVQTGIRIPEVSEIITVDPNVQMLDKAAIAQLRENGITGGGNSLYLRTLDDLNLGPQITGATFRRDSRLGSLHLDFFLDIDPGELSRVTDYRLSAEPNVNPWAAKTGANPLEARVSEFLGKAPVGRISGMVSEVKQVWSRPNKMTFRAADPWGLK